MKFTPPPDHGTLDAVYIADVLGALYRSGRTGALRVERSAFLKTLYIQEGQVAYASSNAQTDRLGEVLVRHGLLTPEQLEDAMKRLQPDVSLGKILVQLGYLSPKELVQGARLQVAAVVDSLFQWTDGTYHFMEGPLPKQVVNLHVSLPGLVLECAARHGPLSWVRRYLPEDHDVRASLLEPFYRVQPEMTLPADLEEVFTWLDGQRTIEEIAAQTGLNAFFIARVITGLGVLGLAEVVLTPRSAPAVEETAPAPAISLTARLPAGETPVMETAPPEVRPTAATGTPPLEPTPSPRRSEPSGPRPAEPVVGVVTVPSRRKADRLRRSRWAIVSVLGVLAFGLSGLALWVWLQGRPSWQGSPMPVTPARTLPPPPTHPVPREATKEIPPVPPAVSPPPPFAEAPGPAVSPPSPPSPAPPPVSVTVETKPSGMPAIGEIEGLIRQGDLPGAARRSMEWLQRQDPEAWTVQVELACRPETVRQALEQVRDPGRMYVLPKRFRNQPCYVVGYGVFPDRADAEGARETHLSEELRRQASPPRVLSVRQMLRLAG